MFGYILVKKKVMRALLTDYQGFEQENDALWNRIHDVALYLHGNPIINPDQIRHLLGIGGQ